MFIDTHTHLYDEQLIPEIDTLIQKAIDAGVSRMYMPNCDSSTIAGLEHITAKWPANCFPMMGVHPCYIKENYKQELDIAAQWIANNKCYAIGEIGLDYYWDLTFKEQQIEAFETQIDWALQKDLPIVIHSRESTSDCIDIVRNKQNGTLRGIFHCFSGTTEEAQQICDLGFMLGIGGVVTFKKSTLPDIVKATPLSHIVLETDAPYLAPMPYRGKRNESSYIPLIAAKVAEVTGMAVDDIATITTQNAEKIFTN